MKKYYNEDQEKFNKLDDLNIKIELELLLERYEIDQEFGFNSVALTKYMLSSLKNLFRFNSIDTMEGVDDDEI